jgi:hypothetical protein
MQRKEPYQLKVYTVTPTVSHTVDGIKILAPYLARGMPLSQYELLDKMAAKPKIPIWSEIAQLNPEQQDIINKVIVQHSEPCEPVDMPHVVFLERSMIRHQTQFGLIELPSLLFIIRVSERLPKSASALSTPALNTPVSSVCGQATLPGPAETVTSRKAAESVCSTAPFSTLSNPPETTQEPSQRGSISGGYARKDTTAAIASALNEQNTTGTQKKKQVFTLSTPNQSTFNSASTGTDSSTEPRNSIFNSSSVLVGPTASSTSTGRPFSFSNSPISSTMPISGTAEAKGSVFKSTADSNTNTNPCGNVALPPQRPITNWSDLLPQQKSQTLFQNTSE